MGKILSNNQQWPKKFKQHKLTWFQYFYSLLHLPIFAEIDQCLWLQAPLLLFLYKLIFLLLLLLPSSTQLNSLEFHHLSYATLHFHSTGKGKEQEMNGLDGIVRWKNLKQRLSFKGLGCCGPTWSTRTTIRNVIEEEEEEEEDDEEYENEEQPIIFTQDNQHSRHTPLTAAGATPTPVRNSASGGRMMNLGMALAAERDMRRSKVGPSKNVGPVKTLMRLIEETDGVDLRRKKKRRERQSREEFVGRSENDCVCCVCMERNKGAALIPCGHTYCRVCSREMWVNRGCCPICNRSILEILDIF